MAKNTSIIELPLEGVDSEHCALIVDKGLGKVNGVVTHKVELNNRKAIIETEDPEEVTIAAVSAIKDLGYGVTTITKSYPVLNMSCASCAVSSESMLTHTPGVIKASVNYANATAHVEYVPGVTDAHQLKKALQSVGYDLMIDETEDAKESLEELHRQQFASLKRKNAWSGHFIGTPGCNRHVLYGYTLCQLFHVGIGYSCHSLLWQAVLCWCVEAG